MLVALYAATLGLHVRERVSDRESVGTRALDAARMHCAILERELQSVASILLHFARQRSLERFLGEGAGRDEVEEEYLKLCAFTSMFDQVRVLDVEGRELLRVNDNAGSPAAVAAEGLQSKAGRYYVPRLQALRQGQIYVSPFDLNLERGTVELPWKPVIRLATPVRDEAGVRRGTLVFNYLGERLLERLSEVSSRTPGSTWLVNQDGHYLEGPDRERSWAFMFGGEPTFAADFSEAWSLIQTVERGSLETHGGIVAFDTVDPLRGSPLPAEDFLVGLKLVSFISDEVAHASSSRTLARLLVGNAIASVLLFLVAWRLTSVGLVRAQHESRIATSEARLRRLSSQLLASQETERKRVARDLHDDLGQLATAVTIELERARKSEDRAMRDELIERALTGAKRMLESVRRMSSTLRSSVLDDLGLEAALTSLCEEFEAASDVHVDLKLELGATPPGDRIAENAYRVVQEALTNVARHAGTPTVHVRVSSGAGGLEVEVRDGGVGFDPDEVDPERLGLLGMRERAELLGGRFQVASARGKGTTVTASFPLFEEADDTTPRFEGRES